MIELLTNAEMAQADRRTIAAGVPGIRPDGAGRKRGRRCGQRPVSRGSRVIVVAGPGNNGGDGFVAARLLAEKGYASRGHAGRGGGPAEGRCRACRKTWRGRRGRRPRQALEGAQVIIDALFGAGLDRPVEGLPRAMIEAMNAQPAPVVAVDLPSGINGTSGAVMGAGR